MLVFAIVASTSASAQSWVSFNGGVYGGLNCSESSPVAGATISMDVAWFRVEFDAGWTYFWVTQQQADPEAEMSYTKSLIYLNPSIGVTFGYDFKVFGLIGMTNWYGIDKRLETYRTNILCPKIKIGGEAPLLPWLSISLAWNYIMNPSRDHFEFKDANIVTAGVLFKF